MTIGPVSLVGVWTGRKAATLFHNSLFLFFVLPLKSKYKSLVGEGLAELELRLQSMGMRHSYPFREEDEN